MTDNASQAPTRLAAGAAVIEGVVRTLPHAPGCYRMLNEAGDVLYVGKARDLRKRVVAYTRVQALPLRLQRMVAETASMEIVTTRTEAEALLLESNLIKRFRPRDNILLKDDKSYPYILVTDDHAWPRLMKHRGARSRPGRYFGPFASAGAVNQALAALQKAFLLRSCSDSVLENRTRPCLLYQIKRCSGPCDQRIAPDAYAALVAQAVAFLGGHSRAVQEDLVHRMEDAAARTAYEDAAVYRDRIRALAAIQSSQDIALPDLGDADVIGLHQAGGESCVQVVFFRGGCNYGNRPYTPRHAPDTEPAPVLAAFLGQFYADKVPPPVVLLSHIPDEAPVLAEALSVRAGHKVRLLVPQRGDRRRLVAHAETNAREALGRRLAETSTQKRLLAAMATLFGLEEPPERVEVYDNSHVQGQHAVGAMIVAGPEGFEKNAYRRFNIDSADVAGDDFAMMQAVLTRRLGRARKDDPDRSRGLWPDLMILDGGRGQLNAARAVLEGLGVEDLPLVAISKGPDRHAGRERFHLPDRNSFTLERNDPVMYFLQRLRDEAHRFAIGSHRQRRAKAAQASPLDGLPGVGPKRRKALLHHFGSARAVADAGVPDLAKVEGISRALAQRIYDHFHES